MSLSERWSQLFEELESQGRLRFLSQPVGIDFTSNDYLGYGTGKRNPLPPHLEFPVTGMASRLLRGHHPIWEQVETALAEWHGSENALMMTSGYAANEGLLSTLIEPQDWVASDQYNHASIIDGLRLSKADRFIFRHNDLAHLETALATASKKRKANQQLFVVTESLFSMEGAISPLANLANLATRYEAHLIIDEAHATGCFGPQGSGLVNKTGIRPTVLATVHTGGKALGVMGAYICCSNQLKKLLVNRCRHLIFTTALPPLLGLYWLETLQKVKADEAGRGALHQRTREFRSHLQRHHLEPIGNSHIIPLLLGRDSFAQQAALQLQERGFDIRAIRPPSVPEKTARLRIAVHADHSANIVEKAAAAIVNVIHNLSPKQHD